MFLHAVTYAYCKADILLTVFLSLPMRVGINLIVSLFDLWWESSRDVHTCTIHCVLFVFTTVLTFIFWSYEPCRYFTAGKIVESWTLSVLHKCFLECYNLSVEIWSCLTLSFVGQDFFIRQDYSQYVMLWCDKNKVHVFFVFLFHSSCYLLVSYLRTILWAYAYL